MAVRLHRASAPETIHVPPAARAADAAPVGAVSGPGAAIPPLGTPSPRYGTPKPSFPPPPTVKLAPPVPIRTGTMRDRILVGAFAAVAGAALCAAVFFGYHLIFGRSAKLEGTVRDDRHVVAAPTEGTIHLLVAPGTVVDAGAKFAEVIAPAPAASMSADAPEAKRLAESLKRAENALNDAKKHQADVEKLFKQERATRSERDDAARDVRFRTAERDRLAAAFANATVPPERPRPSPLLADVSLAVVSFPHADGTLVRAGDTVAVVQPRATTAEAPLGKIQAPDENTPVKVRVGREDVPGKITGLHVDGNTRSITVSFEPTVAPPAPGSKVAVRF
ncbi:MAG TPA: hypothetical protein VMV18_00410 [bacterium]|nr:hypothetical protein [bacterium]